VFLVLCLEGQTNQGHYWFLVGGGDDVEVESREREWRRELWRVQILDWSC